MRQTKRNKNTRDLSALLKDRTCLLTTSPSPTFNFRAPAAKEIVGCDLLRGAADKFKEVGN